MPFGSGGSAFDFAQFALCALLFLFLSLNALYFLFSTAPGTSRRDDAWLRLLMTDFVLSIYAGKHFGKASGALIFVGIVAAFKAADWSMTRTAWGRGLLEMTRRNGLLRALFKPRGGKQGENFSNLGGGSSGGGFSGGGGSFGGGGASGSW